jgi:hypothetical protein
MLSDFNAGFDVHPASSCRMLYTYPSSLAARPENFLPRWVLIMKIHRKVAPCMHNVQKQSYL